MHSGEAHQRCEPSPGLHVDRGTVVALCGPNIPPKEPSGNKFYIIALAPVLLWNAYEEGSCSSTRHGSQSA